MHNFVEQWNSSDYVLLSNVVTYIGWWTRTLAVREAIHESCVEAVGDTLKRLFANGGKVPLPKRI